MANLNTLSENEPSIKSTFLFLRVQVVLSVSIGHQGHLQNGSVYAFLMLQVSIKFSYKKKQFILLWAELFKQPSRLIEKPGHYYLFYLRVLCSRRWQYIDEYRNSTWHITNFTTSQSTSSHVQKYTLSFAEIDVVTPLYVCIFTR